MDGPCLSLVLPAFNEEAGLPLALAEADDALAAMCADYEVLVVDDGSRDDTAGVVRQMIASRPRVRLLRHATNQGYGAALRTGFEAARFPLVAFTDADGQFHLDDLRGMIARAEDAPIVVGYRVDRQDPWRRRFLSRGYNLLARSLLGTRVRDVDCALKVFRREALAMILPEARGFFVNTEMLTRAAQLGLGVVEVGVRHRPRLRGRSTVSLWEVPRTLGHLLPFWWSRVAFAGEAEPRPLGRVLETPPVANAPGSVLVALLALIALAGVLFFSALRAPLLEPQEARYAEIPRQMLVSGDVLIPQLRGEDYLDKPPLFYWAVLASYRLFGVHDWAARLVPGVAGVLTVLVTYLWGRRALGPRAGWCAAVALALTPEFVYRGRMLTFDTLLMLWVTAGLACAHVALLGPRLRWRWWLAAAIACGLGLLTKGPVALVLIAVPVFAVTSLDPRLSRPRLLHWAAFVGVAGLLAGPWFAVAAREEASFAGTFFWTHHVLRFVAPFDHSKPIWFYLPGLLLGLSPWWLLLPGLRNTQRPAAVGFALAAFGWMLLFFSLSGCKRPTYLLPALPPLALALGWLLHNGLDAWRRPTFSAAAAAWLVLLGSAGLCSLAVALDVVPLPLALALIAAAVAALAVLVRLPNGVAWRHTAGVVFAALWLGVVHLLPAYNDLFSLRGQLRRTAAGEREVVCYPRHFESVGFYLPGRRVRVFGPDQRPDLIAHLAANPGTVLLVKSGPVLDQLLVELPPHVAFQARTRRAAVTVGRVVTVLAPLPPDPGGAILDR